MTGGTKECERPCWGPRFLLSDVWRTCDKIRAAVFRSGLNLWAYFGPLDQEKKCLISESQFVNILAGPLKDKIGLCSNEIAQLADYFRVYDGRIFYTQFCEVIHDTVPDIYKNPPLITGLEWSDPYHVNTLSPAEECRLRLLLAKIATLVQLRHLVLRPYFQDYELIAKNAGTVTISHFAQVLHYLKILLSQNDFNLLVKKFGRDNYTVNYVAFCSAVENVTRDFDGRELVDIGGGVLRDYPGTPLSAELPKLARPEVGTVRPEAVFGTPNVFHPVLEPPRRQMPTLEALRRFQQFVLGDRVRVGEFFKDFDCTRCGRVTEQQFRRVLDRMGASPILRLCLTEDEMNRLVDVYRAPNDPGYICYRTFEDDMDQVFTVKELEKCPELRLQVPPREVAEMPAKGATPWAETREWLRDTCEVALDKVRKRMLKRHIDLKSFFVDVDRFNTGHVPRAHFRKVLLSQGLVLTVHEVDALEARYNDDLGFFYKRFLAEVEPKHIERPKYEDYIEQIKVLNGPVRYPRPPITHHEHSVMEILAKIKGKVVREGIRVQEFVRPYDVHNEENVSRDCFLRGLSTCRFELTPTEMDTLAETFKTPLKPGRVSYKRFVAAVEEAVAQGGLERAPLVEPLQHVPHRDTWTKCLDYVERRLVRSALDKLTAQPFMNFEEIFEDRDRTGVGMVEPSQLICVLDMRGMLRKLTAGEVNALLKCFSVRRGINDDFNYHAFCHAVHVNLINRRHRPM